MLAFFLITFLLSKKVIVAHAVSFSTPTSLGDFSPSEVSAFPYFSRSDPSSRDSYSRSVTLASITCLTNISLAVSSFATADTTKLGEALCTMAGEDQCTSITFISQSQEVVTVKEASVTPGVSTPTSVQKISFVYSYSMEALNRTIALSRIINGVQFTSSLSSYAIQKLVVGSVSTVYVRAEDPITSYIGNTQQCLSSYWYLIFCIILIPILGASYHYYFWVTKDKQEKFHFAYPTAITGGTMNKSFNSVPAVRQLPPPPTQQYIGNWGNDVQPPG